MSKMERLFIEIFDRKSRIERQLHQQFESYCESLACNVIAEGRRPPPWLLEMGPGAAVFRDPGELRQPSSSNTKRKTCRATWEFIQGTLPFTWSKDDSDFNSNIHDLVIAPTGDRQNKTPHVAEEIVSVCSRDEVGPTNPMPFESEIHNTSQGVENLFLGVDTLENKASECFGHHAESGEGEEPYNASQCLYRCDVTSLSDIAGVQSSSAETVPEFVGPNIDLHIVEDNIVYKVTDIPSFAKERASTTPHIVKEILTVCSRDEIRPTNLTSFESEIHHNSQGADFFFSNVYTSENKASESLVHHGGSEEGEEPYDAANCLQRYAITNISDTAGVESSCDETMTEFEGSNIDLPYRVEDNIVSKDVDIPSPAKELAFTTHRVVEEILSVCSRDEVEPTNLMPFESEIHHTTPGAEKICLHVDTFENKAFESPGQHDEFAEGKEPYDATQDLNRFDITRASDTFGDQSSCDETMHEFDGSNIHLPYTIDDNIVYKDADIPSLANGRASTTPHIVEEILGAYSGAEVRSTNLMPFESEIHHTSQCAEKLFSYVDRFENKASESPGQCDEFEEGKEPYDATQPLNRFDITRASDTVGVQSSCDETMHVVEGSSIGLPYTIDDNIVYKDADIPSLANEHASTTPHIVEEILGAYSGAEVRPTNLMPFESEIHHTSQCAEKLFSYVDKFEPKASESIGQYDEFEEGEEAYDATQHSSRCDITRASDNVGVQSSCDETMPENEGSIIDLPYTIDDNIVCKDADLPSLANERASTTPHIIEEIFGACSRAEVRPTNLMPFESEIHHTSQCAEKLFSYVDRFENKASESLGHLDGSEEGKGTYDAPQRLCGCDITSLSETAGVMSSCDETMPEYEGFSIDLPYAEKDSIDYNDADFPSLAKERAFVIEQLRLSNIHLTPRSKPPIMNKMDLISDGFHSSPLGILEKMDLGFSLEHNNPDIKHFTASSSIKLMDICCNIGSQLNGPALERSHSLCSSSARLGSELHNPPLTPPLLKLSHGRLSGKRSSSSVKVSSNPELVCFRIDENSSTTEENADFVQVDSPTHLSSPRNIEVSTNSKPLSDVTALNLNGTCFLSNFMEFVVRDSMESVNSDAASSLEFEYAGRESKIKNKKNPRHTDGIKELRKAAGTMRKMSERSRVSCKSSERIRNHQNIRNGCKPSNILSSISSFVPQIQQKQQGVPPLQGKKDIKVKALEAAEAAKRLEAQKKIEREKKKAAAKFDREKLKQENAKLLELKQNLKEEERRKKEEDVAARKRQREEEGKKVKERKRRCIEETRTLQREREDKLRYEKEEKDFRQKVVDEKQKGRKQRSNKGQQKLERGGNANGSQITAEVQHCTVQSVFGASKFGDDKIQALKASDEHNSFDKSYEMSPMQNSDDEDMEEDRRKKKYIPLWARRESLSEIILANQHLDPKEIFSRKQSFNISQVLPTRVLWRPVR